MIIFGNFFGKNEAKIVSFVKSEIRRNIENEKK